MICPNCHETIPTNSKFCPNCGVAINSSEFNEPTDNPTMRREIEHKNVFIQYGKNNFLLLLILALITVGLFFWKTVVGVIALILILMIYYVRATSTNGRKEGTSQRLENRINSSTPVNNESKTNGQTTQVQPVRRNFNSIPSALILLISAGVTLAANFFGNFIQIDAQANNFETSTPMSLYEALNLGGIAAKFTNVLNLQVDIQGILITIFYVLVALPALVILLTFFGGRFWRFILSLLTFAAYTGAIVYLYYITTQLQASGIILGLTPEIMFYVAILSSFIMLIFSTKVKKGQ